MKVLISPGDRILDFTAFGAGMGELLPVIQPAMTADLTAKYPPTPAKAQSSRPDT